MSEPRETCPKCQTDRKELEGGLLHCPKCGFEGDEKKAEADLEPRRSIGSFWLALLTPATGAMLSYSFSRISKDWHGVGAAIGIVDLLVGVVASIYCGIWLARRFCRSEDFFILFAFIFILGIGFVNLIIIFAGCSPNVIPR